MEEVPVDQPEQDDPDHAHGDHGLEVLQPELVLEGRCALLELGAAILEGVGAFLKSREFGIALKTVSYEM